MEKSPIADTSQDRFTQIPTGKILLWLIMVSIVMLFAGLTSGYIVRQAESNWQIFDLPKMLDYSTGVIILSSWSLIMGQMAIKKNQTKNLSIFLVITLLLGIAFCITQFAAWSELVRMGIYFTGNPSGSFLYVLTAIHLAHLVGGIIYLTNVTIRSLMGSYSADNHLGIELCGILWHFLGLLWVYLYIFVNVVR
jgi:cytochrome c oxidase subunit 3